jgi:hypothetical protein
VWKQLIASPNPRQKGFVDCGLFVILGIRLLLAGRRHSQAQCDEIIPKLRQRVLAELLACTLDPTSSQFDDFKNREAQASKILPHVNPPDKVGEKRVRQERLMAQIVKSTARVKIMNPSYSYRHPLFHVLEKILRRTLQMRLMNPKRRLFN